MGTRLFEIGLDDEGELLVNGEAQTELCNQLEQVLIDAKIKITTGIAALLYLAARQAAVADIKTMEELLRGNGSPLGNLIAEFGPRLYAELAQCAHDATCPHCSGEQPEPTKH